MAELVDDGNAFAIPDLWGKSSLANSEQGTASSLALGFDPLSMSIYQIRLVLLTTVLHSGLLS